MTDTNQAIMTPGNSGTPVVKSPVITKATGSQTNEYLVYYFLGAIEILLAFRLIFKLAGANAGSGFVSVIYAISGILVLPFQGIFRSTSTFEPAIIVAIIVYLFLAWGVIKLIQIISGEQQES